MTRRLIPVAAGFVFGLFAAFFICVNGSAEARGFAVLALSAAAIGLLAMALRLRFRARAMVFCAAFAVAVAYSGLYTALKLAPLEALDGEVCSVVGRVERVTDGDRVAITINGRINGLRARILVYGNGLSCEVSDEITLTARISRLEDSPYFRAREYYLPDGILLRGTVEEVVEISHKKAGIFDKIREYSDFVSRKIRRVAGGEAGELLAAMVTGDRTAYSDSLRLKLNRAGVGHLAAVSGLHVSVIAAAVMLVLRRAHAPRWLAALLTEVCVVGFIVFSGLRASAIRAGIMLSVAVLGSVVRRRADTLNTISICAILMTALNPYAAADSSLILSLAGVFGAGVLSKGVVREFGLRSRVAKALIVSACASFATAPFAAIWFDELSMISPITNLFAIPLCSAALVLAMAFAALGCTFSPILMPAATLCRVVIDVCGALSEADFAYLPVGGGASFAALALAAGICAAAYLITHKPRTTTLLAVACMAGVVIFFSGSALLNRDRTQLFVLNCDNNGGFLLRKGAECIIIDFNGELSQAAQTAISRNGITRVRAAALLDRADAGYAAYSKLSVVPEEILLPENTNIFGGSVDTVNLTAESEIDVFDCKMIFYDSYVRIIHQYGEAIVSSGSAAVGEGLKISFLRGSTIIENDEIFVYNGDILEKIDLGRG